jgi:Na+-translocating ferredoxin:NAD+ oxidoreductase RnfD subunit
VLDVLVPMALLVSGTFLNTGFTRKMPLIVGWLGGFVLQAVLRAELFDANLIGILAPMTGPIFVLFTFFMVTDPGTTPTRNGAQVAFGFGVAMTYFLFMSVHVVFALFYALVVVSSVRGAAMYYAARRARRLDGQADAALTRTSVVAVTTLPGQAA